MTDPPLTNRFTDIYSDESLVSSSKSAFSGSTYVNTDIGNGWDNFSKIIKPFNTYPFSIHPSKKITLEDMNVRLGCVSSVKISPNP